MTHNLIKRRVFDVDAVTDALRKLRETHPDTVNPTDEGWGTCLYTAPDNPDHHCIAGQVVFDLAGYSMPSNLLAPFDGHDDDTERFTRDVLLDAGIEFTEAATRLLTEAQVLADAWGHGNDDRHRRTFSEVLDELGL